MEQSERYDAIIIGSGQGGNPLAVAFAGAGYKTALIERKHIGGTCINEGCTPTKTMVASGRVAYLAARSRDYGVETGQEHVDMVAVRQRKRNIVQSFQSGGTHRLESAGVEIITGEACFTGPKTLAVEHPGQPLRRLTADTIVINTGARPADPPLPGLDTVPHLDSTSIMELDEVPEHLLVLGGGYVGLEFGQLFRRLGSRVTIVQRGPQLLGREDVDIAAEVATIMQEDGIEVLLDASATCVERTNGTIRLGVRTEHGVRSVCGTHLLVAAGRAPNTEALHLQSAGVQITSRGFVQVNDRLETSAPGIYAIGDVAGSPTFTHISYDDYRILKANLLDGGNRSTGDRMVPYTAFIDPQLGRVGLGEDEARAQGRCIRVARIPMSYVARALEVDEYRGMVKALVDPETDQILGAAVLGLEGGEIMAMLQIAMMGKLPYTTLRDAVFAHPTLAELLNTLFASLDG